MIFLFIYFICGAIAGIIEFYHLQNKYSLIADSEYVNDLIFALFMACTGHIGLLVVLFQSVFYYTSKDEN